MPLRAEQRRWVRARGSCALGLVLQRALREGTRAAWLTSPAAHHLARKLALAACGCLQQLTNPPPSPHHPLAALPTGAELVDSVFRPAAGEGHGIERCADVVVGWSAEGELRMAGSPDYLLAATLGAAVIPAHVALQVGPGAGGRAGGRRRADGRARRPAGCACLPYTLLPST